MKRIIILGATGSIGQSTIEIVNNYPDKIEIVGLSAHKNDLKLSELGKRYSVPNLVITGRPASIYNNINYFGSEELLTMIEETDADLVVNGIAGSSGLLPSFASVESGKDLALANKETMVMAGSIINKLVEINNVKLLPVDSEHSAIFHLLEGCKVDELDEVILTASGGAFRDLSHKDLGSVTLKDALKHPTWSMGEKITIDSASMANKGLEVIEAAVLFNLPPERIKVLIHPQSYVHSLIRKCDNSMYAQISAPDMKLPIQNAIFYPNIEPVSSSYLNLSGKELTFTEPDRDKYKMLFLAYEALKKGEAYYIAYNAANEVLVDAFIGNRISFLDIPAITEEVLDYPISEIPLDIESVLLIDNNIRILTKEIIGKRCDN